MHRALDLYYKVAIFELELETCSSCTRLALQSCGFSETCASRTRLVPQGCDSPAGNLYCAYQTCASAKLRRWKPVLCALGVYYKVAILELELLRVLDLCSLLARA